MAKPAQTVLPRWRGFNLDQMCRAESDLAFSEEDFRWIADWGFDFVRLPLSYLLWVTDGDIFKMREPVLEKVDQAVSLGRKYGLHVSVNFHRAPGYCVSQKLHEPFNLWKDADALDAFCYYWEVFARRYQGISSDELSFNLVNEPPEAAEEFNMTRSDHERVVRAAVSTIRGVDPERLIIADGIKWANTPCPELADLGVAQSCRAYYPIGLSHYQAEWVDVSDWPKPAWPEPTWPGALHIGEPWDRTALEELYEPWSELARQGIGVHSGEGGAYNRSPHEVFLKWFRDVLEILTSHNIGFAMWNFRGRFGILDSERADVDYEDWHGHKLDRKLLSLMQEF